MITDKHREILKEVFGTAPIRKVHEYLTNHNLLHPRTERVPSYSTVRDIYNGVRPDGRPAEDKFIEEKIFEYAEFYKLKRIKQKYKNDAKAEKLKKLK